MSAALAEYRARYKAARSRLWPVHVPSTGRDILFLSAIPALIYDKPVGPQRPVYADCVVMPTTTTALARKIVREVSEQHAVSIEDMASERRSTRFVLARQEAFYRLRHETSWSLARIGRFLGDRDHTTVIHAVKRHQSKLEAGQ